eukprot:COSAG02_NODE_14155_length_1303_cov_569.820598_1_plen_405_part_10
MTTVQLPFFLNSGRGANRSTTGHAFDVKLDPPAKIPPDAKNTRIFVQSASCVYAFPNVTASNNKIELFYEAAGPPGSSQVGFILEVQPGLYASLDELQNGIARAAIEAGVNKSNPSSPVATVEDFTNNYLEIRENTTLSRVELVIKDQHLQITLDRLFQGFDLFVEVLGFDKTQTLHSPARTWQTTIETETVSFPGQDFSLERQGFGFVDVEWRRQGQTWAQARANTQNQLVYIPNRTYTAKSLTEALNAGIAQDYNGRLEADGRASITVNVEVVTGADNDPSDATVTIDAAADSQSGSPIEAVRFPNIAPYEASYTVLLQSGANPLLPTSEITVGTPLSVETAKWTYPETPPGELVIAASSAASIDNIHALQISAPGLAAGVHVNGRAGSASLCRFPINAGPGD